MSQSVKSVRDVDVAGKRVLVRVDFNVPVAEGRVADDSRIVAAVPTIRLLVEQGARVILCSHLGRPKGQHRPELSLKPVAAALADQLGIPVTFVGACVGADAEAAVEMMTEGSVVLLENLRFHKEEEANDPDFARRLAALAEIYVNDAFGTAHRAHASTAGVADHLPIKVAGLLVEKELRFLGDKTANPDRPFVVILGGAKVSDKISVIDALLEKADTILIGGAMAYTFKLACGHTVGESLSEPDKVETAREAIKKAEAKGVTFLLPLDNRIVQEIDFAGRKVGPIEIAEGDIPDGWQGVDIGPRTVDRYREEIARARTILWNGPMGVFEIEACSQGTFAIAEAVASNAAATSIIGGGDSVTAIRKSGFSEQVSFMSTGGGASLEFLEGRELPGVAVLDRA